MLKFGKSVRRAQRRGFSIVEIIVALLIMAAIAAVMVPAMKSRIDASEAAAIIDNLKQIRHASLAYRDNVGRYPKFLTQLQARPSAGAVGNTDICNVTLPQPAIDNWKGPYLAQRFTGTGLQVGGAIISNTLDRNTVPPTASQPEGFLKVSVNDVEQTIAQEVDRAFDPLNAGIVDLVGGSITWANGLLTFWIAIRSC